MGMLKESVNRAQFDNLRRVQRDLHDLLVDLDALDTCGVECQETRNLARQLLERTQKLEAGFFTPPPTT